MKGITKTKYEFIGVLIFIKFLHILKFVSVAYKLVNILTNLHYICTKDLNSRKTNRSRCLKLRTRPVLSTRCALQASSHPQLYLLSSPMTPTNKQSTFRSTESPSARKAVLFASSVMATSSPKPLSKTIPS